MGFLGGAALLTAAVAVSKLLGALYKIPLGNLLGSRGMGCFQAAYNVYGVLLTLSTAGLPLAMSRLIAQSRGRPRRQRRIFHVALALFLALGLVAFEKYGLIQPTEKGWSVGRWLLHRHEVLHRFFCMLNGSTDELELVEQVEHYLNEGTVRNLEGLLERLEHGEG